MSSTDRRRLGPRFAALLIVASCPAALALNADQSLGLTTANGWRAFELLSQGDSLAGIGDAGYGSTMTRGLFDGLGLYRDGMELSVWLNHETTSAAISRVDLDLTQMRSAIDSVIAGGGGAGFTPVLGVGYAYDAIYDGGYHAVNQPLPIAIGTTAVAAYSSSNFSRFCSGTSHPREAFGPGRGFLDSLYLTGEEVTGGHFYALDESTRTLWEATDLGLGSWENAAAVDTGNETHVALVLSSDVGSGTGDYLRLYVGRKEIDANGDGAIDFLERNGLRGGDVYYFVPNSGSTTDLPDGAVSGLWSNSTAGALRETKLEDIHTNPANGRQLVLADQTDGIYRLQVDLAFTPAGTLDVANSPIAIDQLDDDDVAPIGAPDNVTWSRDGKLYVQEDGDGDQIFQMNAEGGGISLLATAASEPSGVIDASELLGYYPGSVLLTSLQGGINPAQLGVLVAPTATRLLPGDYNRDGVVDTNDYSSWAADYSTATFSMADGNEDGVVDLADYTVWRDHAGPVIGARSRGAVPEPTSVVLGMLLIFAAKLNLRRD
ncbi:hypothetical protein [Botrimarina hoheduenensis]|uniref:Dockerin domain-containing protein n=1 Tax=Botrimarina hoheduenensis TaxID=2528000 RepID=A0A5C5WAW1_9BACT|nr:hypothetical protein [Botrimarina hoheduenensis]TWT47393.1 hypothetical protein Pla111_10070 [Botrimarina hoheduenensis]